jgi:hypothetical protein
MQNKLEREIEKQRWIGEIHEGGEGLHLIVLPSKKRVLYKLFTY